MKPEILTALKETKGYVSGQELCEKLGVSRTAVWKGIKKLKQEGYEIEAVPNRGYHLVWAPDLMNRDELLSVRKTDWLGNEIHYFQTTDSTNIQAKNLAEAGSAHGTIVAAGAQTAGRGRRGRYWETGENEGIYMTLLLRPQISPNNASMLTLVTALAVARALEEHYEIPAKIKWPNDIVLNGKKICGILTEMSAEIDYINYVVIGIGINVHNRAFPEEMVQKATSLLLETGKKIKRVDLLEDVLEEFEKYYAVFIKDGNLKSLREDYDSCMVNRHRQVKVMDPREPFEGQAMGITDTGELIVDTWEARKLVSSGEVSVRGIYGYV